MTAPCTLPMLLAEWETFGSTEPFPMAAAGVLLRHMNRSAPDDRVHASEMSVSCVNGGVLSTRFEPPPQRYTRKSAMRGLALSRSLVEPEPLGAAGTDPGDAQSCTSLPPRGPP